MARAAGRSASRLLLGVVVLASVTTALLSLDTTVVLLDAGRDRDAARQRCATAAAALRDRTPRQLRVAAAAGVEPDEPAGVRTWCRLVPAVQRADGAALAGRDRGRGGRRSAGCSGGHLAALIAPSASDRTVPDVRNDGRRRSPCVGFGVASPLGLAPVWVATAGAAVLVGYRLLRSGRTTVDGACAVDVAVVLPVRAGARDRGARRVRRRSRDVDPTGRRRAAPASSPLLGVAAVAAVISNLINNLPATLLLLPMPRSAGSGRRWRC